MSFMLCIVGKDNGYGKNLSPLFGSWSSTTKLNVFGCDEMGGVRAVGGVLGGGSHCSTVERLYAWEKKLYEEVKVSVRWVCYLLYLLLLFYYFNDLCCWIDIVFLLVL